MRIKLKKMRVKYQTTALEKDTGPNAPSKKNHKGDQASEMAKAIAFEICGMSPYEKKAADLIKSDQERKCKRFLKKRLGSLRRAKRKQEEISELIKQ